MPGKIPTMKRKTKDTAAPPAYPEIYRGQFDVDIPTFTPVFRTCVEVTRLRPVLSGTLTAGSMWVLLYVFHPIRFRLRPTFDGDKTILSWRSCQAGSALLIPPDLHYQVDTRGGGQASHHTWLHVDGLHAAPVFSLTGNGPVTFFKDPHGVLGHEMTRAVDDVTKIAPASFWTMQVHGKHILDMLATAKSTDQAGVYMLEADSVGRRPDPVVARVLNEFESHIGQRLRLRDLSKRLHMSASTISHRFQAATGEAPMQTLLRMRIFRAKGLLLKGLLLTDIADQLGFYDDVHFAVTFKKQEGITPSQFARYRAAS